MLIKDGDTVATGGFVGSGRPKTLTSAVEKRFLETGEPKILHICMRQDRGNRDGRGSDHFAHEGLVKELSQDTGTWLPISDSLPWITK